MVLSSFLWFWKAFKNTFQRKDIENLVEELDEMTIEDIQTCQCLVAFSKSKDYRAIEDP